MPASGKAAWTACVAALLALGVPVATSIRVPESVHRDIHHHSASGTSFRTQAAAGVTTATATCTSAWTNNGATAAPQVAFVDPGTGNCPTGNEWCGYIGGDTVWTTTTTLSGSGTVAVTFSNTYQKGVVNLYLNGNLLRSVGPFVTATENVAVQDGDILALDEVSTGIIGLGSVDCTQVTTAAPAATGDPHLQNVHGERFDLMVSGSHLLINIPRGSENALLRVQADARRVGQQCTDMYFQAVNVTGTWAEAHQAGGYHYSVSESEVVAPGWVALGNVDLKIVRGHTDSGVHYFNVYVKHLGRAGYAVGGLLGEDDHHEVSTPTDGCRNLMSLDGTRAHLYSKGSSAASTAEGMLD